MKLLIAIYAITVALLGITAWESHQTTVVPPIQTQPQLGVALPQGPALFETSLQSRITSSDSSMTLVSTSTASGEVLQSGYHCFTLDEGRTDAEFVCGTLTSARTITSLERGVSYLTASTTVAANQHAHRTGANVKVTDYPVIQRMRNQLNGSDTIPNILSYAAGTPACASAHQICDYTFITGLAFSGAGVIDASSVARGVVELATGVEAASSTAQGSSGILAIPATLATSTYNSGTAALRVVMTGNGGKIDNFFIATTTLFTNAILATTTQIGAFPAWQIGLQSQVFSSPGTTTFTPPSGITKVSVTTAGAGGGAGACNAAGSHGSGGGGGGAGGIAIENVDVTGTSSIQVFVGTGGGTTVGGTWSTFGTNGFYNSASGGSGAADESSGAPGGVGSGGDFNIQGGCGGAGMADVVASYGSGGAGGSNMYGGGGAGTVSISGNTNGNNGGAYGGGGGGPACLNNAGGATAGSGGNGLVIVRW
jgi:hypothetical protein